MSDVNTSNQLSAELSREERRQQFIESGWWGHLSSNVVPAYQLYLGEQRLDGGYYAQEALTAARVVRECGFDAKPLEKCVSDVFILGRFRRIYTRDRGEGYPYLSASEALEFRPISNRHIAKGHAPKKARSHFVKRGWLLVSASGTVGRLVISTKRLEDYFLTHDLIRIVPNTSLPSGYFSSSEGGKHMNVSIS